MKAYLHIGTEKTGTTSIQHFLRKNRKPLLDYGLFNPSSTGEYNDHDLVVAAYGADRQDDNTIKRSLNDPGLLEDYSFKIIQKLNKEIRCHKASKQKLSMVFSSEYIHSRLTTETELRSLKQILESIGFQTIVIVIYLRNPVEIAASLYSSSIKSGSTHPQPPPPNHSYFYNVCHHQNSLMRFAKVFGEEALIPRLYRRPDLKDASVVTDFLKVLGVDHNKNFEYPGTTNRALSNLGVELLRRINKEVPLLQYGSLNPLRSNLVSYFEKNFCDRPYVIPQEVARAYEDAFQESNEFVRHRWFPNKRQLFPEIKEYENTSISLPSAGDLDTIADVISAIWKEKQGQIVKATK